MENAGETPDTWCLTAGKAAASVVRSHQTPSVSENLAIILVPISHDSPHSI